ncbi:MAG: hypothetical protein ACLGHN_14775, partial [Bacteriovoracia bacterium]
MIFRFFFIKEFKKYPFFFLLLFFTLFLGTLGLVGISIVSTQVQVKLNESANELLTSDLAVSARRDLFPEEKKELEEAFSKNAHDQYKIIDIYSMVSHLEAKASRLVEIRATEKGFPFYGKITLHSLEEFNPESLYVSKDLADLWN